MIPGASWLAFAIVLGGGTGWLAARGARWPIRALVTMAFATSTVWVSLVFARPAADHELALPSPVVGPAEGFASSDTCRSCHPAQYATWHDSFHRTMTQQATPEAVLAPFDGRILEERGRRFRVYEREGRYYAAGLPRTDADTQAGADAGLAGAPDAGAATRERRVVLTTGSHHMQAYWVAADDGTMVQFPFVYFIHEDRWLANDDSFLQSPYGEDDPLESSAWHDGCVTCHSTGGPWDPADLDREMLSPTAVTELGVACEQCHGEAGEHVLANRSPVRRFGLHQSDEPDETIVNPRRLDPERAASVCGQCHTVASAAAASGDSEFAPGESLLAHLDFDDLFATAERTAAVRVVAELSTDDRDVAEAFWTNGAPRVAGREFDAMLRSACFSEGGMTCISCHTMHGPAEGKQLPIGADNEMLCGGTCHGDIVRDVSAHSHHEAGSTGSECVNCHMPYASYGLLNATRSHQLDSPAAGGAGGRDAPNACNLCHLDQSLAWTAARLTEWYGAEAAGPPLAGAAAGAVDVPAGALWMVGGDAVQRTLAAWHAGWEPARDAADVESLRPALGILMQDQYSVVRQLAGRAVIVHDPTLEVDLDALTREPQPALHRAVGVANDVLDEATVRRLYDGRHDEDVSVPE